MYGYICPNCGAHLDPGERCDCIEEKERNRETVMKMSKILEVGKNGQMKIMFEEAV